MNKTLTIATPCLNEEASLPIYWEKIRMVRDDLLRDGWEVSHLLIDDGSVDRTKEIIQKLSFEEPCLKSIFHPRTLGYGATIKTALAFSTTEWMVFVDADSNYDQSLISTLVKQANDGVDMVNVSILAPGGHQGYPWHRLLLSSVASGIYRCLFPRLTQGIYTLTCGFRLYRNALAGAVFPECDDFVATAEIMLRAKKLGAVVIEYPATNHKRDHGVSKMRFLRVSLGHLRFALKARFGLMRTPRTMATHQKLIHPAVN